MRKALTALSACAIVFTAGPLQAEEKQKKRDFGVYVGAGGGSISADAFDVFDKNVNFISGEVLAGAYWRFISIEARQGVSLEDQTIKIGEDPDTGVAEYVKTSIEDYNSYYLRLQWNHKVGRVYGLIGQTEMLTSSTFEDRTIVEATASGTSYGAGAGLHVNDNLTFNFEIKSLLNTEFDSFTMSSFNLEFKL